MLGVVCRRDLPFGDLKALAFDVMPRLRNDTCHAFGSLESLHQYFIDIEWSATVRREDAKACFVSAIKNLNRTV